MAQTPLEVMEDAHGLLLLHGLADANRRHHRTGGACHIDLPPLPVPPRAGELRHRAVVDPLEQIRLHLPGRVGVSHGQLRPRHPHRCHSQLGGDGQHPVEHHPWPAPQPLLDLRAVLASAADSLDQISLVKHRIRDLAVGQDRRRRHLAGPSELLLVPDEVVVEEQLRGELLDQSSLGVDEQLRVRADVLHAQHLASHLVPVGPALGEVTQPVGEEMPPPVPLCLPLVGALGSHEPERRFLHRGDHKRGWRKRVRTWAGEIACGRRNAGAFPSPRRS